MHWRQARRAVPVVILLILAYGDYVILYRLAYKEIYAFHSHGVAVSSWVLLGLLQLLFVCYYGLVFWAGPGKLPRIGLFDIHNGPLPEYFFCDGGGFPGYCQYCKSIVVPRSKHSYSFSRCIPKFDHFCMWIGTEIGRDNYRYFLKFTWFVLLAFLLLLIYLLRYTPSNVSRGIDHNFIVVYILIGIWSVFLISLLGSHILYIYTNQTMYEDILRKRERKHFSRKSRKSSKNTKALPPVEKRYINVQHGHSRAVLEAPYGMYPFQTNFKQAWSNIWLQGNGPKPSTANKSWGLFLISTIIFMVPFAEFLPSSTNITNQTCVDDGLDECNLILPQKDDPNYEKWSATRQANVDMYQFLCEDLGGLFHEWIDQQLAEGRWWYPAYLQQKNPEPEGPERQDQSNGPEQSAEPELDTSIDKL